MKYEFLVKNSKWSATLRDDTEEVIGTEPVLLYKEKLAGSALSETIEMNYCYFWYNITNFHTLWKTQTVFMNVSLCHKWEISGNCISIFKAAQKQSIQLKLLMIFDRENYPYSQKSFTIARYRQILSLLYFPGRR